jgi:hypothetical protein
MPVRESFGAPGGFRFISTQFFFERNEVSKTALSIFIQPLFF